MNRMAQLMGLRQVHGAVGQHFNLHIETGAEKPGIDFFYAVNLGLGCRQPADFLQGFGGAGPVHQFGDGVGGNIVGYF